MSDLSELLSETIRNFAQDPARAGRLLRQAFAEDRDAFLQTVIWNSALNPQERGFRYALTLLRNSDLLIPAITRPSVTSPHQASGLTRCVLALDPSFVNCLLDALFARAELRDTPSVLRVLDLIGEFPERVANWRLITRLYEQGEPKVRSRCAALLTRFRFDENTAAVRFEQGDSRVRASIVEALGGRSSGRHESHLSGLLETALSDEDNRVAGNACLALYHAGDVRALNCLAAMANREELNFQITAAWAMGQTRDVRFLGFLSRASLSERSDLRATALRSRESLDYIPTLPSGGIPFPIAVSARSETEDAEIWVRAISPGGAFVRDLRPLDFFLFGKRRPFSTTG